MKQNRITSARHISNTIVSGSILLNRTTQRALIMQSKSSFFENDLKIKTTTDSIIFKVAGIDDIKTRKAKKRKDGWYELTITEDLPEGEFEFDEYESNQDVVVVYCR